MKFLVTFNNAEDLRLVTCATHNCDNCPLDMRNNGIFVTCDYLVAHYPEEAARLVGAAVLPDVSNSDTGEGGA